MDVQTAVLFGIGLILLIVGAEVLVRGAASIAASFSISPLVIGLTVVSFGTSSPEIAVSVQASRSGQAEIALGNVIGSNIFNVLFILGLSAIVVPLIVQQQLVRLDVPLLIGVSLLVFVFAWDGQISRLESVVLIAGTAFYTGLLLVLSRRETATVQAEYDEAFGERDRPPSLLLNVAFVGAGLAMLIRGSRWLVNGATEFARAVGVSEVIVSLTIVAAGTSLPEVATSLIAALRGERDIAVGNVVGSNIFNLFAVLGFSGVVASGGIPVPDAVRTFDLPIMVAVAIACLPIFFTGRIIARWEGAVFLVFYLAYTLYLVLDSTGHDALDTYRTAMAFFVLPLVAITILTLGVRAFWQERRASLNGETRDG